MMSKITKRSEVDNQSDDNRHLSFEDLLTKHMSQLWQLASNLCNYNKEESQDLLQDAMLRAFNGRNALMQADNRLAWLRKVIVNTYLNNVRGDRVRKVSRELLETDSVGESYEAVPSSVLHWLRLDLWNDNILRALNALSEESRVLFLLSDVEGYTHVELSELYKLPKGSVSSRIYRARRKLARLLEGYATEQGYVDKQQVAAERDEMRAAKSLCADRAKLEAEAYRTMFSHDETLRIDP